ncbi:hypothetical protein BOTBODRAFT_35116 [Botryobasidium botryosum FD-172 SS1]|uniref:Uncharacterized protein n=1 Tax=Botryobasidium botryosum (strain FD-172 SS1) TaxID=930990 RepID=A0A067MIG3_BOTB1|nr:hypothetical protein BOTBODRAFT_35116 [Botryobasidium botryosum FD-172 SS1]
MTPRGFHNHLNHHLYAAYDLGAPPRVLQAIFDKEKKVQRPIDLGNPDLLPKPGQITEANWTHWLGDHNAYAAYLAFFSDYLEANGLQATLRRYVFARSANENGANMLIRLLGAAFHAFIEIGCGIEFGEIKAVAAGLAQAATHILLVQEVFSPEWPHARHTVSSTKSTAPPSLLSLLREIYDSDALVPPMPYDPNLIFERTLLAVASGPQAAEIDRICSKWSLPPRDAKEGWIEDYIRECIGVGALLLGSTSKRGHALRLDFFLMHVVTSSIFLPSVLRALPADDFESQGALLETWWRYVVTVLIVRGRPRVDPGRLMEATAFPRPPVAVKPSKDAIGVGSAEDVDGVNPWLDIVADALHAPDSHTTKAIRALLYGAREYGSLPAGSFVAPGEEDLHPGAGELDGTIFVRVAGMVMESQGWVTHGQDAGTWDFSGLGYDDAWKGGEGPVAFAH